MHCCTVLPGVLHSEAQRWQPSVAGLARQMLPRALKGWQKLPLAAGKHTGKHKNN
jgi:hypothetical protein